MPTLPGVHTPTGRGVQIDQEAGAAFRDRVRKQRQVKKRCPPAISSDHYVPVIKTSATPGPSVVKAT